MPSVITLNAVMLNVVATQIIVKYVKKTVLSRRNKLAKVLNDPSFPLTLSFYRFGLIVAAKSIGVIHQGPILENFLRL
jgi:hypothetical protein